MILNITYTIDNGIYPLFEQHLKALAKSNAAQSTHITAVKMMMVYTDDDQTMTISVQYTFDTEEHLEAWMMQTMKAQHAELRAKFGTSILPFSTLLDEIPL